jgi:hypothetical protein
LKQVTAPHDGSTGISKARRSFERDDELVRLDQFANRSEIEYPGPNLHVLIPDVTRAFGSAGVVDLDVCYSISEGFDTGNDTTGPPRMPDIERNAHSGTGDSIYRIRQFTVRADNPARVVVHVFESDHHP